MHLTRYTDYSLRVLMYLATAPEGFGTIGSIAAAFDISHNHLTKVVQELGRRGYIDTLRGKGGGIRLRMQPEKINVGRVIRDMETDLSVVECFSRENRCVITPKCILKNALTEALDAFLAVLDRYTLADMVDHPAHLSRLLNIRTIEDPRAS